VVPTPTALTPMAVKNVDVKLGMKETLNLDVPKSTHVITAWQTRNAWVTRKPANARMGILAMPLNSAKSTHATGVTKTHPVPKPAMA